MLLTKFGHACVSLEEPGAGKLVINPGTEGYTPQAEALVDADVVLVTHEHDDHFDADRLRAAVVIRPSLTICAPVGTATRLGDIAANVMAVVVGDKLSVAGFDIAVFGTRHQPSHPDFPPCDNVGFLVNGTVFHPGDTLTVPDHLVETLLLVLQEPWLNSVAQVNYLRAVAPQRALGIHDGLLSPRGLAELEVVLRLERDLHGLDVRRLVLGQAEDLSLPAPDER